MVYLAHAAVGADLKATTPVMLTPLSVIIGLLIAFLATRVWNNLGMACREAGENECAATAFERALVLDPGDSRAAVNLYFLQRDIDAQRAQK